jgi:protocatechuate 4,5-dioxygenase alpha subunit
MNTPTSPANSQMPEMVELADIPGTIVFTGQMARKGFQLNQFCMSLMSAANRALFKADERAYLAHWHLTEAQASAVLSRDYAAMMTEGGNVYFLAKIGATDGRSYQSVAATMSGLSLEQYRAMMLAGGRSPIGNRSLRECR